MGKLKEKMMENTENEYHLAYSDGYEDAREAVVTNAKRVEEFHRVYGVTTQGTLEDIKLKGLRYSLMVEELSEVDDELFISKYTGNENKAALAKELADLLYVVYGTAVTFGIDIDRAFAEVHKSNLSKLGVDGNPIYRSDGKVLKGPNYKEADMSWVK